jgi:hypothetical protein
MQRYISTYAYILLSNGRIVRDFKLPSKNVVIRRKRAKKVSESERERENMREFN